MNTQLVGELVFDHMYGSKVDFSKMTMLEVLEAVALAQVSHREGFLEKCVEYVRTWNEHRNLGEFYSLACALKSTEEMEKMEESVLQNFNPDASKELLPELGQMNPELLVAALDREALLQPRLGLTKEELHRRQDFLFMWLWWHNQQGSLDDFFQGTLDSPSFITIRHHSLRWLGEAQKRVLPPVKLRIIQSKGSNLIHTMTEYLQCQLGSDAWTSTTLEMEFTTHLCFIQDAKIFLIAEIDSGTSCRFLLHIFDEETQALLASKHLREGLWPYSFCVSGNLLFVVGTWNDDMWWLSRINVADDFTDNITLGLEFSHDFSAICMASSGNDVYVLCEDHLLLVEGGDLESVHPICQFTEVLMDPIMIVSGTRLIVFCEDGFLNLDLNFLDFEVPVLTSEDDLQSLPFNNKIFACCLLEGGLLLAMQPRNKGKTIELFWLEPSLKGSTIRTIGHLPAHPTAQFYFSACFNKATLTCLVPF